jgi:L-ascorbate metabolism protein UlaG (beta-lactamase superfamily)
MVDLDKLEISAVEPQEQMPLDVNLGSQRLNLKRSFSLITVATFLLFGGVALAQQIEVLWLGHATFRITSATGKVIVIDPFLKRNPRAPAKFKDLKGLGKVDLILITHGHQDHFGDAIELAKMTGATVVANYELANNLVALGMFDGSKTIAMNKGGTVAPLGSGIKVHMVHAEHSSSVDLVDIKPESTGARHIDGGVAIGYVIELGNGFKIYDAGDTDVFGDMALISKFYKPDLALVSIGGLFTMDPEHAAYALRELIRPKQVIPMHYGTYPALNRTPAELKAALGNSPIKVLDVKPGESVKF